jgi:hypothetical protein
MHITIEDDAKISINFYGFINLFVCFILIRTTVGRLEERLEMEGGKVELYLIFYTRVTAKPFCKIGRDFWITLYLQSNNCTSNRLAQHCHCQILDYVCLTDIRKENYYTGFVFFFQWLLQPILDPGLLFSSVIIFSQRVGLLGRAISPSQGPYLHTEQHKQNKRIQYRHPCLEWDSNLRSQRSSEWRHFVP